MKAFAKTWKAIVVPAHPVVDVKALYDGSYYHDRLTQNWRSHWQAR